MDNDKYEEVRSNWVKFNKADDYVKGVLMEVYKPETADAYGKKNTTYIIKGLEGSFYGNDANKVIDNTPTPIVKNDIYRVGSKDAVDAQMRNIKIGQRVMFRLTELRPSKKGNPAKIIKVLAGPMDEDFIKEQKTKDITDAEFAAA